MGNQNCCGGCLQEREPADFDFDLVQQQVEELQKFGFAQTKDSDGLDMEGTLGSLFLMKNSSTMTAVYEDLKKYAKKSSDTTEIILTVDNFWSANISQTQNDEIDIYQVYKQVSSPKDRMYVERVGQKGRILNLLFQQEIPMEGIYVFQIYLVSFKPCHKLEFSVGIIDYNDVKYDPSNKNSLRQFFSPPKKIYSVDSKEKNKPIMLSQTIRVEVCRQNESSYIAFYVNDHLEKSQKLHQNFSNQFSQVKAVPYVETHFQGITFGWKNPLMKQWAQTDFEI